MIELSSFWMNCVGPCYMTGNRVGFGFPTTVGIENNGLFSVFGRSFSQFTEVSRTCLLINAFKKVSVVNSFNSLFYFIGPFSALFFSLILDNLFFTSWSIDLGSSPTWSYARTNVQCSKSLPASSTKSHSRQTGHSKRGGWIAGHLLYFGKLSGTVTQLVSDSIFSPPPFLLYSLLMIMFRVYILHCNKWCYLMAFQHTRAWPNVELQKICLEIFTKHRFTNFQSLKQISRDARWSNNKYISTTDKIWNHIYLKLTMIYNPSHWQ